MKRLTAILILLALLTLPALHALAGPGAPPPSYLISLEHNAPRTGIMLPKAFDPYHHTYLLTVASWVSRITFTCVASDPLAAIYVNGQLTPKGVPSQIIRMKDEPQEVTIQVVSGGDTTTYTVYLQRRPGYDRVSAGYIRQAKPDNSGSVWELKLDLVTVKYTEGTALSTFTNKDTKLDTYSTTANCICYSGTMQNPVREQGTFNFFKFSADVGGNTLYRFVIIGERVHMILPYASD